MTGSLRAARFQPTLPLRGATPSYLRAPPARRVSTHAPLAGSDHCTPARHLRSRRFNPRSPCGERQNIPYLLQSVTYVSTHAPLAGSDVALQPVGAHDLAVSTHAPLAGSDPHELHEASAVLEFQPTLPLRGATYLMTGSLRAARFQPTLPLRGATSCTLSNPLTAPCFNPRSPCGERHALDRRIVVARQVSTHAPLAGSDLSIEGPGDGIGGFQPTLPLRGATREINRILVQKEVSTHAPLAGSDRYILLM